MSNITLKVKIQKAVADKLDVLLAERGLTIDQAIGLYLRGMVNVSESARSLRLADPLPFGKHRGEAVEVVVRADPAYLKWCIANVQSRWDAEVLLLLETVAGKN